MEVAEPMAIRCSEVVFRGDAVLLCHRQGDDCWILPGGSPHRTEGAAECARREVLQETSVGTAPQGVAFVFDVTGPAGAPHLFEMVFLANEEGPQTTPRGTEEGLEPSFVPVRSLDSLPLRPPVGGLIAALHAGGDGTLSAPYLGNLWQSFDQLSGEPAERSSPRSDPADHANVS